MRIPVVSRVRHATSVTVVFVLAMAVALASPASANSKYAGIVVDHNTGKVLYASSADSPRYPASLTKIMTLYLLFDEIEAGRIKLDDRITMSKHAASMPPSKLGIKPGSTIRVEDAIKALVTKSANDVAAAVGEHIAGSESAFAKRMTRKARALGMRRTTFRNASGLPDSKQKTTARDMATLGRAIMTNHPSHYQYFKTRSFSYRGHAYRNHNRLLGSVDGVDGIKTGYTRASGFNLTSSVRRNNRHLVAVVMGGKTGRSRDKHMASLLSRHLPKAIASNSPPAIPPGVEIALEDVPLPIRRPYLGQPTMVATAAPLAQTSATTAPVAAVAFTSTPGVVTPADSIPMPVERDVSARIDAGFAARENDPIAAKLEQAMIATAAVTPAPAMRQETDVRPVMTRPVMVASASAVPTSIMPERVLVPQVDISEGDLTPAEEEPQIDMSGWAIQIGAVHTKAEAEALIGKARSAVPGATTSRKPFTEQTVKNGTTYIRARFAGFDTADEAKAACRAMKKGGFGCYPIAL